MDLKKFLLILKIILSYPFQVYCQEYELSKASQNFYSTAETHSFPMVSDFGPIYEPLVGKIVNINTQPYYDKDLSCIQLEGRQIYLCPINYISNGFSNGDRVTIIARDCLTTFCTTLQNRLYIFEKLLGYSIRIVKLEQLMRVSEIIIGRVIKPINQLFCIVEENTQNKNIIICSLHPHPEFVIGDKVSIRFMECTERYCLDLINNIEMTISCNCQLKISDFEIVQFL